MVPDNTLHIVTNRHPFGTRGSLTFDFSITPYTATHFENLTSLFYSKWYLWTGALHGIQTPHPPAANDISGRLKRPLPFLAVGVPPEGYGARFTI